LKKQGEKKSENDSDILVLQYPVRKTGVYRLQKVIEKSKLEVQRRMSDTLVVACPRAAIQPTSKDRCIGDLSDLTVLVEGTPPLKIVYSRTINHKDESFHFQSLQPQNLVSPLLASPKASTLVSLGEEDVSWGRLQSITVRLNESMGIDGDWLYSIDEVHDATGNVANFSLPGDDGEHISPKGKHLEHAFVVHERPVAQLACDTRHPLRVASGVAIELPVKFTSSSGRRLHGSHGITWKFSPIDTLTPNGDHGDESIVEKHYLDSPRHLPSISRPGLYTLQTVLSEYCEGEIREPASCLLINPPKPDLSISAEDIYDKCADNSIGILVDLDLTGTPPFIIRYEIIQNRVVERQSVQVEGSRHQLELKPRDAGHFTYRFTTIDDAIYKDQPLTGSSFTLEQDVKPPASAFFVDFEPIAACIDEPIELKVLLSGEPPFALEYELVHEGKRKKRKITGIENSYYNIATDPLMRGGEYSMALASVQDKTGCKIFLNDEIKINVRRQRPKVSFAQIDGKRTIKTLEGKKVDLPVRLEGVGPWTITYRHLDDTSGKILEVVKQNENDQLRVDQRGKYELVSVRDRQCPGTVDSSAASFDVSWISRPTIKVGGTSGLTLEGNKFSKKQVCEGDVDSMEINLSGKFEMPFASPLLNFNFRHPTISLEVQATPQAGARIKVYDHQRDRCSSGCYNYCNGNYQSWTSYV
jgi:nucleoporin POM152